MSKTWVYATDRFLSGWGVATDKLCKVVYECDTHEEVQIVCDNLRYRGDMVYIRQRKIRPYFNPARYVARYYTKETGDGFYVKDFFKKER